MDAQKCDEFREVSQENLVLGLTSLRLEGNTLSRKWNSGESK